MTYQRNGRIGSQQEETPAAPQKTAGPAEEKVRIDGFGQVIALLKHADPEFRQSLLRRLTKQDPKMGAQLQAALRKSELDN
jgi:hypothetical protein